MFKKILKNFFLKRDKISTEFQSQNRQKEIQIENKKILRNLHRFLTLIWL